MKKGQPLGARDPLMRAIFDTIPDALVVIDALGIIQVFSAAAEAMFGYSEAELIGQNVSVLMPSPDRERHDAYIARYLDTGEARIIGIGRIIVGQRHDGSQFPMELSVGDASSAEGKLFVGFIRDLTRRQNAEVRLEELQQELAHVSRVSAMGTMASSLAHELNQPLTAVANYVEAARDMLEAPTGDIITTVREALNDAAQQSIRAGQIVRRLRDFIARGETDKHLENLRILINEANVLALIGTREMGVEVVVDIDERVSQVLVDRVQIQQVLVNLIRNAVDSMRDTVERLLVIAAVPLLDNMVEVRIIDSGQGVDVSMEEKLFAPFSSSKETGMGLGLSICKTIITAHGGKIWYSRPPNGGAAFHFTLLTNIPEAQ